MPAKVVVASTGGMLFPYNSSGGYSADLGGGSTVQAPRCATADSFVVLFPADRREGQALSTSIVWYISRAALACADLCAALQAQHRLFCCSKETSVPLYRPKHEHMSALQAEA